MGETDGHRATGVVRLVLGEPTQLGHGERRQGQAPDGVRPRLCPSSATRASAAGPERRSFHKRARSYDFPGLVQTDHAVLLGGDREGSHVVEATCGCDRRLRRLPPVLGVDLGPIGVRCAARADERSRLPRPG